MHKVMIFLGSLLSVSAGTPSLSDDWHRQRTNWQIVHRGSRQHGHLLCLDAEFGETRNGANVQIFECYGSDSNAHQSWDYNTGGSIVNEKSARCLDSVQVDKNGANVQLWGCSGSLNQQWDYTADGLIRSRYDNRCLQIEGGSAVSYILFNGRLSGVVLV